MKKRQKRQKDIQRKNRHTYKTKYVRTNHTHTLSLTHTDTHTLSLSLPPLSLSLSLTHTYRHKHTDTHTHDISIRFYCIILFFLLFSLMFFFFIYKQVHTQVCPYQNRHARARAYTHTQTRACAHTLQSILKLSPMFRRNQTHNHWSLICVYLAPSYVSVNFHSTHREKVTMQKIWLPFKIKITISVNIQSADNYFK